jgi:hypothetical protein
MEENENQDDWIKGKNFGVRKNEIAGYFRSYGLPTEFYLTLHLKGGAEIELSGESALAVWEAFGNTPPPQIGDRRTKAIANCPLCNEAGLIQIDGKFRECNHKTLTIGKEDSSNPIDKTGS